MFGLVNLPWGDIGPSGKAHGSSTRKTPGLYQVPNWSYGQKSQFIRGCMGFGEVNLLWGGIGLSGKSQGSSMQKTLVSIKSQTEVIAKKYYFKRLHDFWSSEFVVRWYRTIGEVTRVIHAKNPGLSLYSPKLELWPKTCQKSPFLRCCKIFGLVNFS